MCTVYRPQAIPWDTLDIHGTRFFNLCHTLNTEITTEGNGQAGNWQTSYQALMKYHSHPQHSVSSTVDQEKIGQVQANSTEILSLGNEDDSPWNPRVPKTQFQSHQLNIKGFKATKEIKIATATDLH